MTLDRYPDLSPDPGKVETTEVVDEDGLLVKAFALGPGAEVEPHEHEGEFNVFHVLEGTVIVRQDETDEEIEAPGVVYHEPGTPHGASNQSEGVALFTATLVPSE